MICLTTEYFRGSAAGIKNLLGAVLTVAGLLMLFLLGQGLVMLLVGLMIMNYPGKFALERRLIQCPHILPTVNWLRKIRSSAIACADR